MEFKVYQSFFSLLDTSTTIFDNCALTPRATTERGESFSSTFLIFLTKGDEEFFRFCTQLFTYSSLHTQCYVLSLRWPFWLELHFWFWYICMWNGDPRLSRLNMYWIWYRRSSKRVSLKIADFIRSYFVTNETVGSWTLFHQNTLTQWTKSVFLVFD